jgi:hypothetical protein
MQKVFLSMLAAAALATAIAMTTPAGAAPASHLGALSAAAATLSDVESATIVCGRWRCWQTWGWGYGYRPWGYGYRPWGYGYRPWGWGYAYRPWGWGWHRW